ncbi:Ig-like domain-containing protein [Bremerella sp. T1]|uniref:Ig-like domain-containing protein n=1 Tax=Bremerella sp. TYQ1 TaxID=3119568 RepID=UPI001CCFC962|nr:Ig-like domain-containing protein [Bremerella volcania]UBM36476.1 tandem-95 repeat protein [Bremerella volcania]
MRFKRPKFQSSLGEQLEDRSMLSGTPLDLDLSAVPTQTVFAGETLSFNLGELGATVSEGEDGPRMVMFQLDPDGDERPDGMSMTFSGDFQWTPTAEQEGLYSVKIIAVENGQPSSVDVEEMMIDVRVGRPVVDLNGEDQDGIDFDAVFQVGHGPVSVVDSDLTVSDENDDMIQSAKVTLTNPLDGAEESLSIDVEGTNITVEYADGSILLSGEDTAENYANVLKTLTYNNTNADADPTSRLVEISVSDGEYESQVATSTIAVNHAPDLLPISDQTVEAGQSEEFLITATDKNESDELFLLLDVETPDYVTLTQEAGTREATLSIAPGADVEAGEYTIRVLAVDQYGLADAQYFTLTIEEAVNSAPTISPIDDQSIDQDTPTDPLAFSIGDAETAPEDLTVSIESDNEALVDAAGIVMTGEGADRELVVTPLAGATGTANITITVSDGEETVTESFLLTVNEVVVENTAPTVSEVEDVAIDQDTATEPLAFVVGDAESAAEDLVVSVESDNPALVEAAGMILAGDGADKTLVVTPLAGATGTATITISVSDGEETTTESFVLTVNEVVAGNTAPTVSEVEDVAIDQDTATEPLAFTVGDAESAAEDLVVSVESDNAALVDAAGIILTGDGADKTLVVTPLAGATGSATITISVSDGEETTTESFVLTVNEVVAGNTAPTISVVEDQEIDQDSATEPLAFTVGDAESAAEDLVVSVESDNPALVDAAGLIIAGDGADKTLVVTPLAGATGTATITLSVSDGEETTTESFVLTVTELVGENTAPTISAVEDQTIDQDTATAPLEFSVSDAESAVEDLVVSVESDNPALVDAAGIILTGEGADKTLVVTPLAGATGSANITITVSDGEETTTESFLLTVNEVVLSPIAEADSFATDANTPLDVEANGVLGNDTGDSLGVTAVNGDAANVGAAVELDSGASVTINADGSLSFDPTGKYDALADGETAVETVSYTTTDALDGTASADVEITITGVNDAPVAEDDAFATESDTALTLAVSGVITNDSDVDNGDTMTVSAVNGDAANVGQSIALDGGGLLTLNADGSMTFDPNGEFEGLTEPATVEFGYTVSDALGLTSDATVTITVSAPSGVENENAAPINSVPGEQSTDSATPIVFDDANGNAISVSDPDAADSMVEVTITVDSGLLTLSNGFESNRHKLLGSIDQINSLLTGLVYTPDSAFEGTATLTIVTDDLGNTGFGGAKADADSILIAVSAAAVSGVDGEPEGEGIDVIAEDDEEIDDLFNPCDIA